MKLFLTDSGSGIMFEFARAIGASVNGRFIYIPESKGEGYITGFAWENDLWMLIRNYHLKEDIFIERTNEIPDGQSDLVIMLSGVFPSPLHPEKKLLAEQANVMICMHAVSSVMNMPSNTVFGSITIRVSRPYLLRTFGHVNHPVVASVLQARDNFVFETGISASIINTASEMLGQPVPAELESHYYKLKCEELLCHIFALLMQREAVPTSTMHIKDIKAIYAVKARLQSQVNEPPDIGLMAKDVGMSEPKLRKLFKQTFGKGIFEYYQSARMLEAARLLRENRLSVAETGYQLGFTNLSHFARVFEQHIGSKPKRYATEQK